MSAKPKNFVKFLSPGTFFVEVSSYEVKSWDLKEALKLYKTVKERYNALPFGFIFEKVLSHEPINDGNGGTLKVEDKVIEKSGIYYITGDVFTYDDILIKNKKDELILRDNMRCNRWWTIVKNYNSFISTTPFNEGDFIIDMNGVVVKTGKEYNSYRKLAEKKYC